MINFVLSRFGKPFLQLFQYTAGVLLSRSAQVASKSDLEFAAQTQVLLVEIYYDLTCQDLPPDFEDTQNQFFGAPSGLFLQFLDWDPSELRGDVSLRLITLRSSK